MMQIWRFGHTCATFLDEMPIKSATCSTVASRSSFISSKKMSNTFGALRASSHVLKCDQIVPDTEAPANMASANSCIDSAPASPIYAGMKL